MLFRVGWHIDVDAETPQDAARKALKIQRDPNSIATVFHVSKHVEEIKIDLQQRVRPTQPPPAEGGPSAV